MSNFIFMLTRDDVTVGNARQVYDQIQDVGLQYVGFKDIGLPVADLKALTRAMHDAGQQVMLEVVSEREEDELRSARAALELGVDYLLGGTHADRVAEIVQGSGITYCPFPGRVVGHPSQLLGTVDEIVQSARQLAAMKGVGGLDLLAYRHPTDGDQIVRDVVRSVDVPVIVAGSVASIARVEHIAALGAWGFTVGGAVFDKRFVEGGSIRDQIEAILHSTDRSDRSAVLPQHRP